MTRSTRRVAQGASDDAAHGSQHTARSTWRDAQGTRILHMARSTWRAAHGSSEDVAHGSQHTTRCTRQDKKTNTNISYIFYVGREETDDQCIRKLVFGACDKYIHRSACIYIYIYIYMCIYIYIIVYIYIYIYVYILFRYILICIYRYVHMFTRSN